MNKKDRLPLDILVPFFPPLRITRDEDEDRDFQASLREHGIRYPLLVRPHPEHSGKFEVIDGNRRLAHATVLGIQDAPCDIKEMTDEEAYTLALLLNIQRSNVDPAAIGNWLQIMQMKFGCTQQDLADKMGKNQSWVSRNLKLIKMRTSMPHGVTLDTPYQARILDSVPDEVREEVLREAEESGKLPSAREIERRSKAEMSVDEVLSLYPPNRYDEEFVEHQIQKLAGVTSSEARDAIRDSRRKQPSTRKRTPITDRRHSTVQVFEKLGHYYPMNLIDIVTEHTRSTNLETLVKYCRRLTQRLFEVAPPEMKQSVLQEFI